MIIISNCTALSLLAYQLFSLTIHSLIHYSNETRDTLARFSSIQFYESLQVLIKIRRFYPRLFLESRLIIRKNRLPRRKSRTRVNKLIAMWELPVSFAHLYVEDTRYITAECTHNVLSQVQTAYCFSSVARALARSLLRGLTRSRERR